jgi:hypothetical protein
MPQNRQENDNVRHASRYSGLLRLKVSQTRIFQSDLKTGGGATVGGARDIIMEIAWS